MSFFIINKEIVLCSGHNILIYNLEDNSETIKIVPKFENSVGKDVKSHNNEDIELFHSLTSAILSDDQKYFAVYTNRKQLCLYKTKNYELVSNRCMIRAASKVNFVPNNDVVVADKSGDAYLFSTKKPDESGELLLGHLSMLLDILVTEDEKYIITADRDEKIRVSMFPNSYNILSYCLGHKSFVTNIALLPHDNKILLSCGGDGTLMFWNFESGTELKTVYFHEQLPQSDVHKLNHTLKEYDIDGTETVSPVKNLRVTKIKESVSLLTLSFYCSNKILIYSISTEDELNVKYVNSITTSNECLDCLHYNNHIWVLTDNGLECFPFQGEASNIELSNKIQTLNKAWKKIHNTMNQSLVSVLYKRKFDNIQDYQEKKKLRLNKNNV